jgi:hypothetical protein
MTASDFRLTVWGSPAGVFVRVWNDGPHRRFRAEILSIHSPHFRSDAEETDWPWPIRWGQTGNRPAELTIAPANRGDLNLAIFDERGLTRQLQGHGGFPFVFPGPRETRPHRIHARLGATTPEELRAERLDVAIRVVALGNTDTPQEAVVSFEFQGKPVIRENSD